MEPRPSDFVLEQNLWHIHTDKHFVKIVKLSLRYPKIYKSVKNGKSKIFTTQILSSHIEYRRKFKKKCNAVTGWFIMYTRCSNVENNKLQIMSEIKLKIKNF